MRQPIHWGRAVIAGGLGGAALIIGLIVFFGPVQGILSDPAIQSPKMIAVFTEIEPLPRVGTQPWAVAIGFILLGVIHGLVFAWLAPALPGDGWRKGFAYGLVLWLLMVTWFEFFILWNVMHEPVILIALEGALWLLTLQVEGLTIAAAYNYREKAKREVPLM